MNLRAKQLRGLRSRLGGFTLAELMVAMMIFVLVAMAGAYLIAALARTQNYVEGNVASTSQVEFAVQRIIENIRSANAMSTSGSSTTTITITSPPSPLISDATFTITYTGSAGGNLTETYVNNTTHATYSSGVLVDNVTQFTIAPVSGVPDAYQITLNAGSVAPIQRTFVVFGRNL
jgi:prepilin-type N-terminal cleavage/methylation domain-containing protein